LGLLALERSRGATFTSSVPARVQGGGGAVLSLVGQVDCQGRDRARGRAGVAAQVGEAGRRRRRRARGLDERGAPGAARAAQTGAGARGGEGDSAEGRSFLRAGDRSPAMTFRLVEAERAEHSISRLCSVLGVSRVGFYAWRTRLPSARVQRDRELEQLIHAVFVDSRETYGAPRVHAELRSRGVRI